MPPQPLSNVRTNAKLKVHSKSLERRSDLAPFIAKIIAGWALVEVGIGTMLSFILEAEFAATAAMLYSLRSSSAQIDAVAAAGKAKLTGRDLEMFEAVLIIARAAAKKRNAIAHHVWAHSDELPDALLLVEPQAYVNHFVELHSKIATKSFHHPWKLLAPDPEHVFVYREKEFDEIIAEIYAVQRCVVFASFHLDPKVDGDYYQELCEEPLIADALERMRKKSR